MPDPPVLRVLQVRPVLSVPKVLQVKPALPVPKVLWDPKALPVRFWPLPISTP